VVNARVDATLRYAEAAEIMNNYYNVGIDFTPGTTVRSADVDTELAGVETGFDFLPTVAASLHRNTTSFATETGSGNAFVVAMPNTRTVNQNGDEVEFYASHGNTGAATLNVDGIGAVSIRDHAGVALVSGAIVSGRLYVVRYDNANGFFVITTTFGTFVQQSNVSGTGTDDPTSPGTFNPLLIFETSLNARVGDIGYNADIDLSITNKVHGGNVVIAAENAAGALQTLVTFNSANDATLPALAFGDGDSGFYEPTDDTVRVVISGVARWAWTGNAFSGEATDGPLLSNVTATATVPTLIAKKDDADTGIGAGGTNRLSLISGGVEAMRFTGDLTDILIAHEVNVGLTADAGSSQGDGPITSSFNVYSTVGSAGDAATLPSQVELGMVVYIKNDAAVNSMDVFPASGDDAGAGTDVAVAIAAGDFAVFMVTVAGTTWTKLMGGTA